MTHVRPIAEPAALSLAADGALSGRSGRYVKRLSELSDVYLDSAALGAKLAELGDVIAYRVDESRADPHPGGLVIGTSTLTPGSVGTEYFMTRGTCMNPRTGPSCTTASPATA